MTRPLSAERALRTTLAIGERAATSIAEPGQRPAPLRPVLEGRS